MISKKVIGIVLVIFIGIIYFNSNNFNKHNEFVPKDKNEKALVDYIKSYNYEIISKDEKVYRYILDKSKLYGSTDSVFYQQVWGVQYKEPDKYFSKEIKTYSFVVKKHPLEKILNLKDGVQLCIMQVDDEIIGGYSGPTYEYVGSNYSIDGKTLEEVTGLSYQEWRKQWKEKYGK